MRLPFLKHLLDSVLALARPRRAIVLGSSSLLPQHPELGEAGHPVEMSLVLGRQKDLDLLRALLKLGVLEPARLRAHYHQTPLGECEATAAGRHLTLLLGENGAP